jgi:hypothetical protein
MFAPAKLTGERNFDGIWLNGMLSLDVFLVRLHPLNS